MAKNSRSIGKPQLHWLQETPGQRERRFDARSPHRATQLASRRGLTNGDQVQKGRVENPRAFKSPQSQKDFHTCTHSSPQKIGITQEWGWGVTIPEREYWVLEGKRNHRGSQSCIPNSKQKKVPVWTRSGKKADALRKVMQRWFSLFCWQWDFSIANCDNKLNAWKRK